MKSKRTDMYDDRKSIEKSFRQQTTELIERAASKNYQRSPVAANPRGKVMSIERVLAAIAAGIGQGRDAWYQPWIRVRRRLVSPVSNLFVLHVPLYERRSLHLLSMLERQAAQVAIWLGATELREQFPLWPEAHLHPCLGRPGDIASGDTMVTGLLDIAQRAGIRHGTYIGTNIPYVATTDLLIEVMTADDSRRLVMWQVKPDGPYPRRVEERLALENLYAREIDAFWKIFTPSSVPRLVADQLDWFMPRYSTLAELWKSDLLGDFSGEFMCHAAERTIAECRVAASEKVGVDCVMQQHTLFKAAAWTGLIPIDFAKPILLTRHINLDKGFKNALRRELFGVC